MQNEQDTSERLKNLIARFVLRFNYWGYLFSRVRRKENNSIPSIMGVSPEPDGTISLLYNKELVDKTGDEDLTIVIEHEGMHILNKHIPRLLKIICDEVNEEAKQSKMQIFNLAADCAVNEQAKFKKEVLNIAGMSWPLYFPKTLGLQPGQITEKYYLDLLEQNQKQKKSGGSGKGDIDKCSSMQPIGDHSNWDNLKGVTDVSALSRKVDQHIRGLIKESVKSFSKERGSLPSHISELIQSALETPKVPYYQLIRKLIRGSRFSKFTKSPTRINRKRTYVFSMDDNIPEISPFPGKKRDFTFDIVVMIDTSGSMSRDDILEGLSGVKNIIENDRYCRTTVLEVDAGVEKEYICKKINDIQFNIKGRGGTTLAPGLLRAKELNCDVCLAFTDGYTDNINAISRKYLPKKLIWVITDNGDVSKVNKTGFVVRL